MISPYTLLDIELSQTNAVQYIRALDAGGLPWSFVGDAHQSNCLVLHVDGDEGNMRIVLNPGGTWTAEMAVEVPVQ